MGRRRDHDGARGGRGGGDQRGSRRGGAHHQGVGLGPRDAGVGGHQRPHATRDLRRLTGEELFDLPAVDDAARPGVSGGGGAGGAAFQYHAPLVDVPGDRAPALRAPAHGVMPPTLQGFTRRQYLGEGDAGVAYLEHRVCGTFGALPVAVKYLRVDGDADRQAISNELRNMRKLAHPNVVAYLTSYACNTHLAIVMEYCAWDHDVPRTLHDWVQKDFPDGLKGELEPSARCITAQLVAALTFMHSPGQSVVHRDINPQNILLQKLPARNGLPETPLVKLADFGSSKDCEFTAPRTYRSTAAEFASPERLVAKARAAARKSPLPQARYRGAEDMWSLGVVVLTMLCGKAPINFVSRAVTQWQTEKMAANGELVPLMRATLQQLSLSVTGACYEALLRLLCDDPDARATAEQMAQDPWVVAAGYTPNTQHYDELLAIHGRQSDAEFEDVLRQATGGGVVERMSGAGPGMDLLIWVR